MNNIRKNKVVETPSGRIGIVEDFGVSTVWVRIAGDLKSFRPDELKEPATIKSYDGSNDVSGETLPFAPSLAKEVIQLRSLNQNLTDDVSNLQEYILKLEAAIKPLEQLLLDGDPQAITDHVLYVCKPLFNK